MMNHVHVNGITMKKVNFRLATARCLVFGNMARSNYEIIWTSWPQRKELWWWEDVGSRSRLQITCDLLVGMERRNEQPDSYSPCSYLYFGWLQTYPNTSSSSFDFVWLCPPALSIMPLRLLPVLTPKLYSTLWGHVPLIPEEADGDPQFATESELSPTASPRSQDDIARCKVHDVHIINKNQELHLRILLKKYPYRCLPLGPFLRAFFWYWVKITRTPGQTWSQSHMAAWSLEQPQSPLKCLCCWRPCHWTWASPSTVDEFLSHLRIPDNPEC